MRLFGKKEKEEDEKDLELEEGDELEEKPLKRIKRISTKKREPVRPWTKKDRLILLYLLIGTVVVSAFLALSSYGWKLPNLPRFVVPQFNFSFLKGEPIVFEKEGGETNSEIKAKETKILSEIKTKTNKLTGVYGIYVVDLNSGYSFGVYEKEKYTAASLIKLPVIASMYKQKEVDLGSAYSLKTVDKVSGSGSLSTKPEGYKLTYNEILYLMGHESDNTAFNISRKLLGDETINANARRYGMKSTDIVTNTTTPLDIGTFFKNLYDGEIVDTASRDVILESLTNTIYEDYLPKGVPGSVKVSHKYGREVHVINDAGIVFAKKPYVLVLMTKGVVDSEAEKTLPEISQIVYKTMNE